MKQDVLPLWQNNGQVIAVAHRGGNAAGPNKENSLAAVEAAVRLGYSWFETDVVTTSDDVLIAIHGKSLLQKHPDKNMPSRSAIQSMSYSQVKRYLKIGGEPPARLIDLIASFPGTKWFIDRKTALTVEPLIKLMKDPAIDLNNISIGSVGIHSQARTKAIVSAVKQARGENVSVSLNPFSRLSYALLAATDIDCKQLKLRDRLALDAVKGIFLQPDLKKAIKLTYCDSLHVPYDWISFSTNFIELAHSFGLKVASWTPNAIEDIKMSVAKNVDAVMSDNISLLKQVILTDSPNNQSVLGVE